MMTQQINSVSASKWLSVSYTQFGKPAPSSSEVLIRLSTVTVRNFRCIKDLSVDLDELTVLVGENNSGKTAFLKAIQACLDRLRGRSRSIFHEYDYHLADETSTPSAADPIEIELVFEEPAPNVWPDEVIQELDKIAVVSDEDRYKVTFSLSSSFDAAAGDFVLDWSFLDAKGNPLTGATKNISQLATVQRLCPAFYLSALRDAAHHFASRGRYWRAFLSNAGIPEASRLKLEAEFSKLNDQLLASHKPLGDIRSRLENAKRVIDFGAGDAVAVEALPTKLFTLLDRTQVSLSSRTGAKIPVDRQGEGTQSLAVLLLFDAFLHSKLAQLDSIAEPITALEEPEAHLHPCAIRALMELIRGLPGQKLISTHSGDFLATVSPYAVRRFVHLKGKIQVFRVDPGSLDDEALRKFNIHVRHSRGELLFARCWLLGEGETEAILFAGVADALGLDLERAGVRCVEYSQTDVGMLTTVANQLGIAWYCVVDDDSGRRNYERTLKRQLAGAAETDRLVFPYENVEQFLCAQGFGHIYEAGMSSQKRQPTSPTNTPEYWTEVLAALPSKFSKPAAVIKAVIEMQSGEKTVPTELETIVNKAIELAGG